MTTPNPILRQVAAVLYLPVPQLIVLKSKLVSNIRTWNHFICATKNKLLSSIHTGANFNLVETQTKLQTAVGMRSGFNCTTKNKLHCAISTPFGFTCATKLTLPHKSSARTGNKRFEVIYWIFLFIYIAHIVISSLNGNNGSATNTDDVKGYHVRHLILDIVSTLFGMLTLGFFVWLFILHCFVVIVLGIPFLFPLRVLLTVACGFWKVALFGTRLSLFYASMHFLSSSTNYERKSLYRLLCTSLILHFHGMPMASTYFATTELAYRGFHGRVDEYLVCSILLPCFMNPQVLSQLNGNNGSWTNTDDVKTAFGRRRVGNRVKEVKVDPIQFKESEPGTPKMCKHLDKCVRTNCKYVHPPLAVVEPTDNEPPEPEMITLKIDGKYFDGKAFHFKLAQCDPKHRDEFQLVELQSFTYGEVYHPYQRGFISLPMFYQLTKEMGFIGPEVRNQNAVSNYMMKRCPTAPPSLITRTSQYYLFKSQSNVIVASNGQDGKLYRKFSSHCIESVNAPSWAVVPCTQSVKVPDYKFNFLFQVLDQRGFTMDYEVDGTFTNYPMFDTSLEPKQFVYYGCSFNPKPEFSYYGRTAHNATLGLARYFAQRPNEDDLNSNQLKLLNYMPYADILDCCRMCGGTATIKGDDREVTDRDGETFKIPPDTKLQPLFEHLNSFFSSGYRYYLAIYAIFLVASVFFSSLFSDIYLTSYAFVDRYIHLSSVLERPTPKREVYLNWFNGSSFFDIMFGKLESWTSKVKFEVAKYDSYSRLFASADWFCLADPISPEILKKFFSTPIRLDQLFGNKTLGDSYLLFSDCQEPHASDQFFHDVVSYDSVFAYFSDDGFIKYTRDGVTRYVETDISKCDMSNRLAIFVIAYWLLTLVFPRPVAELLIAQCAQPTKLPNPDNRDEFVLLRPWFFFEYSGSLLTTILNNIASLIIMTAIYIHLSAGGTSEKIVNAAMDYGWVLTVKECPSIAQVTFLKRFYDGQRSVKCLGTILRSFGAVEKFEAATFGITTKQFNNMTKPQLFELYCRLRVLSYKNEPGNFILDALRSRFSCQVDGYRTPDDCFVERYGLDALDIAQLTTMCNDLSFGDHHTNVGLQKVFSVDYGVPFTELVVGDNTFHTGPGVEGELSEGN